MTAGFVVVNVDKHIENTQSWEEHGYPGPILGYGGTEDQAESCAKHEGNLVCPGRTLTIKATKAVIDELGGQFRRPVRISYDDGGKPNADLMTGRSRSTTPGERLPRKWQLT